jgi:hypothetical protein
MDRLQLKFGYTKMMGKCSFNQFKVHFFDKVELEYKLAIAILLYHFVPPLSVYHNGFPVFGCTLQ